VALVERGGCKFEEKVHVFIVHPDPHPLLRPPVRPPTRPPVCLPARRNTGAALPSRWRGGVFRGEPSK
jgi:hypothetical protein